MILRVKPEQLLTNQQLQQLALFALMNGVNIKRDPITGICEYLFDDTGELYVQADHLGLLFMSDVEVEKATIFVEMTPEEYNGEVPEGFPERSLSSTNEDGITNEVLRIWNEYAPFSNELINGNFLVRCVHVSPGSTNGNGLSAEQFKIWYGYFNTRILTKLSTINFEFKANISEPEETDII